MTLERHLNTIQSKILIMVFAMAAEIEMDLNVTH